jgi:phosphate starvation-inducible membrane PsiE
VSNGLKTGKEVVSEKAKEEKNVKDGRGRRIDFFFFFFLEFGALAVQEINSNKGFGFVYAVCWYLRETERRPDG